ncbi:LOW QUALITY PROTEIN: S-adenosyl-L-methionine-dependent methyltransferase, partial [Jimgerdemannia flammicorona]
MEMSHYGYRYLFRCNFNAPVEDMLDQGGIILDVGCGRGPWTMEMAKSYPKSSFVGIDKEDCFPASNPGNCVFQIVDLLKGLPFKDNTFDYVYSRGMYYYFSFVEWQQVVEELRRVTKPGGYVELGATLIQAVGGDVYIPEKLGDYLAGFDDLTTDYASSPIGWKGRIGQLNLQNMELSYTAHKLRLCNYMRWTEEEYEVINEQGLADEVILFWCLGLNFPVYLWPSNFQVFETQDLGQHPLCVWHEAAGLVSIA